jgi:hypothetical protein
VGSAADRATQNLLIRVSIHTLSFPFIVHNNRNLLKILFAFMCDS